MPTDGGGVSRTACYMGFISHLASKPEVLRLTPLHRAKPLSAVAGAIVQGTTVTESPLTDAGLDGEGEVIQVRFLGRRYASSALSDVLEGSPDHVNERSSPHCKGAVGG